MDEIALLGSLELELTIEDEKVPILELETALEDKTLEASELDPLLRTVEDTILDELCVTLTVRGGGIGISAIEGHELHVAGRAVDGGGLL